jgi:hypothetical protein
MAIDMPDGFALPKRRNRKRPKVQPATQEERDALRFEAIKADFNWTNDDWGTTWLPWVRISAVTVNNDDVTLKDLMQQFVATGEASNVLEGLTRTKMQLKALHKLVDAALSRSLLVLERLGYSPDNPLN